MSEKQNRRNVPANAIMAVIQVVAVSGILFVLYKFLLGTIGVKDLGIWSVVLATTSAASASTLGLSGSVIKFVAKYVARGEDEIVARVIQTALISIAIFSGLLLLAIYPLAEWILGLVIPAESIEKALAIFPYAVVSFWGMMMTGVLQSGLDGCQRIAIRSVLLIASALFHLVLAFLLVPRLGLMGLAYARVIQSAVTFCAIWAILKRLLPCLPIFPRTWDRDLFREMIGYGLNFQVISISQMLCDPVTKALLSKFGGLAMVGFYEMANRMLLQFRMLFVSANQVLVPAIAELQEKTPHAVQGVYKASYRLMLYIAFPAYTLIIAVSPLISELWIGNFEPTFVFSAILLGVSLLINTLNAPAYFAYLGVGTLKWNTISHVLTALLNLTIGLAFGLLFGGWGVVAAWVSSSIAGSMMLGISFHISNRMSCRELLPVESLWVALSSSIGLLASFVAFYALRPFVNPSVAGLMAFLVWGSTTIYPAWIHPERMRLTSLLWAMKNRRS